MRLLLLILMTILACPNAAWSGRTSAAPSSAVLILKDAPIREAFQLLFTFQKVDWGMGPGISGVVSLTVTEKPLFEKAMDRLVKIAQVSTPILRKVSVGEKTVGVYYLNRDDYGSAQAEARALETQRRLLLPIQDGNKDTASVPRRVCGILSGTDPYAILITGVSDTRADVRVVKVGSRVPGGVAGAEDLTVTSIGSDGVTLRRPDGQDGQEVTVALSGIPADSKQ